VSDLRTRGYNRPDSGVAQLRAGYGLFHDAEAGRFASILPDEYLKNLSMTAPIPPPILVVCPRIVEAHMDSRLAVRRGCSQAARRYLDFAAKRVFFRPLAVSRRDCGSSRRLR